MQAVNSKFQFREPPKSVMRLVKGATERNFTSFLEEFEAVAKRLSPVETGHNRSQIQVNGSWDKTGLLFHMEAFTTSGYGAWLELGTSRKSSTFYSGPYQPGHWRPYFKPAFEESAKYLAKLEGKAWE